GAKASRRSGGVRTPRDDAARSSRGPAAVVAPGSGTASCIQGAGRRPARLDAGCAVRACEIASLLSAQVDGVVRHLLPNGRRVGQEWRVGGIEGEAGKSMGVHLGGGKP